MNNSHEAGKPNNSLATIQEVSEFSDKSSGNHVLVGDYHDKERSLEKLTEENITEHLILGVANIMLLKFFDTYEKTFFRAKKTMSCIN